MIVDAASKADRYLNPVLAHELFKSQEEFLESETKKQAAQLSDLSARNIQRGRDHGVRFVFVLKCFVLNIENLNFSDYNTYRTHFGLKSLKDINIEDCIEKCCNTEYSLNVEKKNDF